MQQAHNEILTKWVGGNLATAPMPSTFATGGIVTLDLDVIDRHRAILAPDPPMKPFDSSVKWVESGPGPVLDDLGSAVLMVRVGLAYNALSSQLRATKAAESLTGAANMSFILSSLVTTAALTNEALQLARSGMQTLRRFSERIGARKELAEQVGKLLSGKHPATGILSRARNKLGFHWDEDIIANSVRDFGRNKNIVWFELDSEGARVDRLSADVLAHALIPEANESGEAASQQEAIRAALGHLSDATNHVMEFFTACSYGYMLECRASKTRERGPSSTEVDT